jgi:hypothetical protein
VQYAARGRGETVGIGTRDTLEHLIERVGIGEDVVRRLPVGMLVGIAEARQPQRRGVGERPAKVGRSGACANRGLERINNPAWIVIEQLARERSVVRPAMHPATGSEHFRQLARCFITQRKKIHRLAPGSRFLGAARRHHLAHDRRQHGRCVLPADQVEALERLVDEVERMSAIGERPLGFGREQGIRKHSRRETRRNRGEEGPLGRVAMAHFSPTPQPAFERGWIRPASEWRTFPSRRLALTIRRDAARSVEERKIRLLLRQHGQKIGKRREDRKTHAPAVAVLRAEQRHLPHDFGLRYVCRELAMHGLGDDQAEVVGEAVSKPSMPVRRGIGMTERGLHPHIAVAHLDRADRNVVRPQVEGAAAFEIEPSVVPMTGQDTVLEGAALEWEAHMRTTIVEREDAAAVVDDEDGPVATMHNHTALRLQLLKAAGEREFLVRRVHEHTSVLGCLGAHAFG